MRIVLDTNVFISGIFFTGPPYQILKAWRDGRVQLLVSPSILDEYRRIGAELASQFRNVDLKPFLDLLTVQAEIVLAPTLPPVIRDDPSDDKFLEAAVAGNASYIISHVWGQVLQSHISGGGGIINRKVGHANFGMRIAG
jgi:putative PIN family toxin of toxin-antitoxin system